MQVFIGFVSVFECIHSIDCVRPLSSNDLQDVVGALPVCQRQYLLDAVLERTASTVKKRVR